MTKIADAISAYSSIAKPAAPAEGMDARDGVPATDFSSVLKDATKMVAGTMKEAEQASAAAISGKADIREVVNAVANAEMTLETVVAVRDKVVNAYNEILRMPI